MRRNEAVGSKPTLLMSLMNQSPFQSNRFYKRYARLEANAGPAESPGTSPDRPHGYVEPNQSVYVDNTESSPSPQESESGSDIYERALASLQEQEAGQEQSEPDQSGVEDQYRKQRRSQSRMISWGGGGE